MKGFVRDWCGQYPTYVCMLSRKIKSVEKNSNLRIPLLEVHLAERIYTSGTPFANVTAIFSKLRTYQLNTYRSIT